MSLVSFFVAPVAGRLSARMPVRWLIGGGLLLVGTGLLLMSGIDARSGWTALLPGFLIAGAGVGWSTRRWARRRSRSPRPAGGHGVGINSTFRQIGIAMGIAAYGALFQHLLASKATGPLTRVPAEALATGRVTSLPAAARPAYLDIFTASLSDLFVVAAIVAFAGAVLSAALFAPARLRTGAGGGAHGPEATVA